MGHCWAATHPTTGHSAATHIAGRCLKLRADGTTDGTTSSARLRWLERNHSKSDAENRALMVFERGQLASVLPVMGGGRHHHHTHGLHRQRIFQRSRQGFSTLVAAQQEGSDFVELPTSVDYISSSNNAYLKHLVKLRQSAKTRNAAASVLVMGTVTLREICESVEESRRHHLIEFLLVREDAGTPEGLASFAQRTVRLSVVAMSKLSGLDSPPDAVGVLPFPSTFITFERYRDSASFNAQLQKWCSSPRRILVLDSIQDPGNLGTLVRTAAAFAWDGIFLLPGCCDPFNDKALRAARGASFRVPIAVGEWDQVLAFASVHKLKLYAGDPEPDKCTKQPHCSSFQSKIAESARLTDDGGLCLVLGSEGQGLSSEVIKDCSSIAIPMPGKFESLNVAVAGGILMFFLI